MNTLSVLIPTDFSEVSLLALDMAGLLEAKLPVRVHLLHVLEVNDSSADSLESISSQELLKRKHDAEQKLANMTRGKTYETLIKTGLLTDQINAAAEELNAGLVIMGTHGSAGFMEKISGSEAQHVVRQLKIPVLTIRAGAMIAAPKNILLVSDFELLGTGVQINIIKAIAEAFDSTIHLLQIVTEGEETYADEMLSQMERFAREHQLQKYETHLYRDRKVADGVRNFNKEAEMDLVCIRTHGRKGISHLLFGSIAERLVNHCIRPLLTFQLKEHA